METPIQSHHHLTLCVGGAQDDYQFHVRALGLRNVKKTLLYDGRVPIYHLYYGNTTGEESTLITCFPMEKDGRMGRPGSGQVNTVNLTVPEDSLDYWQRRLTEHGIKVEHAERYGAKRLVLHHPCGIEYQLVGVKSDSREPWKGSDVPAEAAIRGLYGVTVAVRDAIEMNDFMTGAMGFREFGKDGNHTLFGVQDGAPGKMVEVAHFPDMRQGSWGFGQGIVHHVAFKVKDDKMQADFKDYLEGLGYTDCSEPKNRGYFMSVYFRTPGGTLFEAAYTLDKSFAVDEPYETLGAVVQTPPWLADKRDEILAQLEPLPVN